MKMEQAAIDSLFEQFSELKVLVVGDVMLDTYVKGEAKRISPEAPVPVVTVTGKEERLGGAANVALNIHALGAKAILCSIIGEDRPGESFVSLLGEQGIDSSGIIKSGNRRTTVKTRVVSGSQQLVRYDEEDDHPLTPIDRQSLIEHIANLAQGCQVVIFEDYDKGALDSEVIAASVKSAHAAGAIVVVDPKKKSFLHYKNVELFKPNLRELAEGLDLALSVEDEEAVKEAALLLKEKINCQYLVVTLGERGILYTDSDSQGIIQSHLRNVSDVSGAGDTVVSIAALALATGASIVDATAMANLAGGIVCEYAGVVPIDPGRFQQELKGI